MGLERHHGNSEMIVCGYKWCHGVWRWRKDELFFGISSFFFFRILFLLDSNLSSTFLDLFISVPCLFESLFITCSYYICTGHLGMGGGGERLFVPYNNLFVFCSRNFFPISFFL